jgi:hypothetical protein
MAQQRTNRLRLRYAEDSVPSATRTNLRQQAPGRTMNPIARKLNALGQMQQSAWVPLPLQAEERHLTSYPVSAPLAALSL